MATTKKHSMPFCPSAIRAKNVGVIVNCIEYEKPRLLFSAKKLSEKDKTMLQTFLDTIFYTCGMAFHNTCDLAKAIPKQQDGNKDEQHDVDDEPAEEFEKD